MMSAVCSSACPTAQICTKNQSNCLLSSHHIQQLRPDDRRTERAVNKMRWVLHAFIEMAPRSGFTASAEPMTFSTDGYNLQRPTPNTHAQLGR